MALETTKTTYLNGSSKDGNRVLANFSSSLSESGTMTINETISESTNLDTVEADFNEFRELAKNELKKLNGQDTSGDKEVVATTSDNEAVKDSEPMGSSTKIDDKPETDTPDEAKVSDVKDGETKQPIPSEETKEPVASEETKEPVASGETKQPISSEEVKASDVKDGENVDESN